MLAPMKTRAVMLAAAVWCGVAGAEVLELPLVADTRLLADRLAAALAMDADGRGRLVYDACNRADLSDLVLTPGADRLGVSMAVTATTGVPVLDRCLGPGAWRGRLQLTLAPAIAPSGLAIRFTPEAAELLRPDGSPGLLTAPTRLLAENLILPRLGRVRVDLAEPLATLDALLAAARPAAPPGLAERTRLTAVRPHERGVAATLRIDVPPAPARRAEPALAPEALARWARREDELDGFLTTVIAALAAPAGRELQLELLAVLLDARHAIARALAEDEPGEDPVRRLFIESWERLRPHLAALERRDLAGAEADLRLAAFIAGGDALRALDALGPEYGLEITRDGLRRLARLLLADTAPAAFTPLPLAPDPELRRLFGLRQPAPQPPPAPDARRPEWLDWLLPPVRAHSPSPAEALRGRVPRLAELDEYLELVAALLEQQTRTYLAADARVPPRLAPRFDPLVRATAWKESCWRQFTGSPDNPQVLTSAVGALGMMQINGRVWRGLYDLERLAAEVDYNLLAGIEILEHYLVDYAIRRGEHEHPGGDDNLIRATYAAYNGGPSQLSRYRREDTPARLQAIDDAFWRHYRTLQAERWPEVASCYPVG